MSAITDTELSALVAEKVMGWTCDPCVRKYRWLAVTKRGRERRIRPHFATDPGLALEAALKALEGRELTIVEHCDSWFEASYRHVDPNGFPGCSGWVNGLGQTLSRALCIVALRAIGVDVQDNSGGEA